MHVNRILHGLRNDGILAFHYRRLRNLNPDKLLDAARVDPQTIASWTAGYPRLMRIDATMHCGLWQSP